MDFLYVALGGAMGSMGRYALSLITIKAGFPLMTFLTNLLGAFIIGLLAGYAARKNISAGWLLFLKTGFCGGFTTFSTFSLEAFNLLRAQAYFTAAAYALLSLLLCVAGAALGFYMVNKN